MSSDVGCFAPLLRFGRRRSKSEAPASSKVRELIANDELPSYSFINPPCAYCDHGQGTLPWSAVLPEKKSRNPVSEHDLYKPEVLNTIEDRIDELSPALRKLSLDIWNHPEIGYEEIHAHDTLTAFMSSSGFSVTPHYLGLDTAWRASFTHGTGGRVLGVNSEMDALPGIGHACGHNLVAIGGVAVALAVKAAMEKYDVSGTVVLLGTPAEESGGGKVRLIERGAYKEMDACVMSHPQPGPALFTQIAPCLACQPLTIEFFGHGAHAALAPWEAQNALDAAVLAYSSVSVLRQQLKPDHRVHGIISGRDWTPNVIPDYAKMQWIVRAPSKDELEVLREKVIKCFEAAALATSCKYKLTAGISYYDLRQNPPLSEEYVKVTAARYGMSSEIRSEGIPASTDFGNVTYELPSLHPAYAIPTQPNGGNHTPQFAASAKTEEAHAACIAVSKGLAATGFRILNDEQFFNKVKKAYDDTWL